MVKRMAFLLDALQSGCRRYIGKRARTLPTMPAIRRRQHGAFAIMSVPIILILIVFCGLVLDLGRLYNRKTDLSGFAKAVALAAAHDLNGKDTGITEARKKAKDTAEALHYQYFEKGIAFIWDDAALSFSSTPSGSAGWSDGGNPSGLYFAKVDTSALTQPVGLVKSWMMGIVAPTLASTQLKAVAVAGRTAINATPIAICAMDEAAATERTNPGAPSSELVEYGFRRGVTYDLMQLNPNGTSPISYLVNPIIEPGVNSATFDTSLSGAFVCTGTMWVTKLSGGFVRVSSLPTSSPLLGVYAQLNSRFDDFNGAVCNANGAPPDYNIKAFGYDKVGGVAWMVPAKGNLAAAPATSRSKLETIADLPAPPSGTTAGSYGPVWAYARAVKYASYVASGKVEPLAGYDTFLPTDWPKLYPSGPSATGYKDAPWTPYQATSSAYYSPPRNDNLEASTLQRRVLNVPLLSCPLGTGANLQATVKGIGKFFMTVPATKDSLVAEFAGTLPEQQLTSEVEILP